MEKWRKCSSWLLWTTTIALWSIVGSVNANLFHDSNLDWKTIETEHYYLHFHDGEEQLVRDFLPTANAVHKDVTHFLNWTPENKTHVIFTDEFDVSNGFATVFPRNNTHIYISAPDDIFALEDHNGWLELVFRHEYLHIVHLDKARGAPLLVRKILGRHPFFIPTAFPNAFQPNWYIEGLATYYETDNELGIGRGQSTYYNMLMRMELLGGLKDIRQINQRIATWPGRTVPYLYGVNHYQFIKEKYGEEKIQNLVEGLSDNIMPYRIDSNTKRVFAKDLDQLWAEFKIYLHEKHDPLVADVKAEGLREGVALSDHGYNAQSLQAIDDQAYYVVFDGLRHYALMRSQAGKAPETLRDINFGARLSLHRKNGVLITQPERCRNARLYYDIYRMDLDGGGYERLTDCSRFRFAVWTNKGDKIIAVHNKLGINSLQLLDENAQFIKKLWTGENGEQISHPTYAPDDDLIIASVWRKDLGWNLESFDLATHQWTAITRDKYIQAQPSFLPDGSLVYISDENGIYNVYKLNLQTKERSKLTNLVGGAFSPSLTENGLYYLGYRSQGFDLFHIANVQEQAVERIKLLAPTVTDSGVRGTESRSMLSTNPDGIVNRKTYTVSVAETDAGKDATKQESDNKNEELAVKDYSPWKSLSPTWWLPFFVIDDQRTELGVQTYNYDALFRHTYSLALGYDYSNNILTGGFDYVYDGLWPLIHLGLSRNTDLYLDGNDDPERIRLNEQAIVEIITPFTSLDRFFTMHVAALTERERDSWVESGVLPSPKIREDIAAVGMRYNSAVRYPLSVSRSGGRVMSLVYEDSDVFGSTNNTRKGQVTVGEWREFIHLGREHVLALRLVEGRGRNNPSRFRLGGIQDFYADFGGVVAAQQRLFNKRNYSLRGYDEGRIELIGKNMRLFSLEYRLPIWRIERGWMVPPFGMNQIHATVFYDTGGVWDDSRSSPLKYYDSLGVEFNTEMDLFYSIRLHLTVGLASGLDSVIGEEKAYLRIGNQF